MKIRTRAKIALAAATLAAGTLGAKPALAGTVTVKGSDTMVVLGQRWAEEYMKKHAATTIQVTGGGSGTGISALINGTTDVCEASRAMKDAEKKQLADKAGAPPVEITVAKDGLSVYVNDSNPLNELTMDQLKQIFTGKVDNWKARRRAGRQDHPLLAREQLGHLRLLQGARAAERRLHAARAGDAGDGGGGQRGGEGEVRDRLRRRRLRQGDQGPQDQEGRGVAGDRARTDATIKNGTYPLSRPLFFYVRANPSAEIKAFTDWVLSAEGQGIVTKVGYFPIK